MKTVCLIWSILEWVTLVRIWADESCICPQISGGNVKPNIGNMCSDCEVGKLAGGISAATPLPWRKQMDLSANDSAVLNNARMFKKSQQTEFLYV